MSYNIDGFNERMNYIQNSNNIRRKHNNFDNSFAKMRSEERRNIVETTNTDRSNFIENVRGSKDNFVLRNNAINNVNHKQALNNPVQNALNRNMFKNH